VEGGAGRAAQGASLAERQQPALPAVQGRGAGRWCRHAHAPK
jgi:hypothetical protein